MRELISKRVSSATWLRSLPTSCFLFLSVCSACHAQPVHEKRSNDHEVDSVIVHTPDEEAVLALGLKDAYLNDASGVVFLSDASLTLDPTETGAYVSVLRRQLGRQFNEELLKNHMIASQSRRRFSHTICPPSRCFLRDYQSAEAIVLNDAERLNAIRQYPGLEGLIALSRVGFTADRMQAVLYRVRISGPKSGSGQYVFLAQKAGQWKIEKRVEVWLM